MWYQCNTVVKISIHALLAESDDKPTQTAPAAVQFLSTLSLRRATVPIDGTLFHQPHFYPRSPCGERLRVVLVKKRIQLFLSTLSLRRATPSSVNMRLSDWYFYPRSPCGERRWLRCWQLAARDISIHALLAESDGVHYDNYNLHCVISIHALLAESDRPLR